VTLLKGTDVSTRVVLCGLLLGATVFATTVSAQSPASQYPSEDWQFEVVPYLWGSGVNGQVGVGARTANVDASFSNILDHLHFAAMGLVDAQRDRLSVVTDAFYTDLRGTRATPGPLFSSVSPQQRIFILTPEAGYRVRETPGGWVDLVGGIRLWRMTTELQFQPGVLPALNVSGSRTWVDGIVGARARKMISNRWWASAYGDLGGGGSSFTYQLVGTAGLDIHEHYALTLGYRYLDVDYDKNNFVMDTAMKGPVIGFTFKFPGQ
jgi:hypothetical protein